MLVLSRYVGEELVIAGNITLKVLEVEGGKVRLGITAPREIPVHRAEVAQKITAALAVSSSREVA